MVLGFVVQGSARRLGMDQVKIIFGSRELSGLQDQYIVDSWQSRKRSSWERTLLKISRPSIRNLLVDSQNASKHKIYRRVSYSGGGSWQ